MKNIIILAVLTVGVVVLAVIFAQRGGQSTGDGGLQIVSLQYGQSARARSRDVALGMIQANEKLDGFFASNEPGSFGVLRALEEKNLKGKIKFVGFDASADLVKGLRDGYIDALVAQDPFDIGYSAVRAMIEHLDGKPVEKVRNTKLQVITPGNLDTQEIKDLLNPPLEKYLNAPAPANPKYRIAVVPKGTVHIFWQTVHAGAMAAGADFNAEVLWKGTEDESQHSQQASIIEGFIVAGVDGIVVGPTQADAQVPAIERAVAKGIPVVIFDSGANTDKAVSFVATDNYKGGALAAKTLAELMGGKGNIAVVATMPGGASTTQRERGFLETMKNDYGAKGAEQFLK